MAAAERLDAVICGYICSIQKQERPKEESHHIHLKLLQVEKIQKHAHASTFLQAGKVLVQNMSLF